MMDWRNRVITTQNIGFKKVATLNGNIFLKTSFDQFLPSYKVAVAKLTW